MKGLVAASLIVKTLNDNPYIAINTLPVGLSFKEVSFKAFSVIDSGIWVIYPLFKSPVFIQGIFPL